MVDVQFEDDPINSYLETQRQIFYKPSTSPVVNTLIEKHVFDTEKKAAVFLLVATGILTIIMGFLFSHFTSSYSPTINTHKNFVAN